MTRTLGVSCCHAGASAPADLTGDRHPAVRDVARFVIRERGRRRVAP
jgi:hypothetical protein